MQDIEAHVIHPKGKHRASIIWLHGLGADGFDFAPVAEEFDFDGDDVKFIFPHAPIRPVTISHGFPMRAWYDIFTLDRERFIHDIEGIQASAEIVNMLIQQEIKAGVRPEHIILAGFSQGGAIALFAGLTSSIKVGGILALSTYLPADEVVAIAKKTPSPPILYIHGTEDQTILLEYAELSRNKLLEMGCELEFVVLPMGHTLIKEEVKIVKDWIGNIL